VIGCGGEPTRFFEGRQSLAQLRVSRGAGAAGKLSRARTMSGGSHSVWNLVSAGRGPGFGGASSGAMPEQAQDEANRQTALQGLDRIEDERVGEQVVRCSP